MNNKKIKISSFDVDHGYIKSTAYIIDNKIAYVSDCNKIYTKDYKYLKNIEYFIVDCLRIDKHPSHFNLDEAVKVSKIIKPRKTILTNLHVDFDYRTLKKFLPKNIIPAYDGMKINF